jgi:hypothetical protein
MNMQIFKMSSEIDLLYYNVIITRLIVTNVKLKYWLLINIIK